MKFINLYTGPDDKSYFREIESGIESVQALGSYSKKFNVEKMSFREFQMGLTYDWHNAPEPQYIIYLDGQVEVEASGGETKIFKGGDVLLASDVSGKGHITRTLTCGRSIIVTTSF